MTKLTIQKGIDPRTNEIVWLMLDENYEMFEPIQRYLTYLSTGKSPNTVEAYAYDLRSWWEFLELKAQDWCNIKLTDIEDFAYWLRVGDTTKVLSIQPVQAIRSEKTVNRAITAITGFYEYHIADGRIDFKQFDRFHMPNGISRQGLLTGIAKSKPTRQKLVKLKEPKSFPGCLTDDQIVVLVNACKRLRDKLIILMLNGTGMRKGELLGLCVEDVGEGNSNFVRVVRRNNPNGARVKGQERTIPIEPALMKLYNQYLYTDYPVEKQKSNYVFVNIWEGDIGMPMKPNVLNTMFTRLAKKTGIYFYPHLFRHTYATRLLRAGFSAERVKYLLGHTSIQTTVDIYSHIIDESSLREIIEREDYNK